MLKILLLARMKMSVLKSTPYMAAGAREIPRADDTGTIDFNQLLALILRL